MLDLVDRNRITVPSVKLLSGKAEFRSERASEDKRRTTLMSKMLCIVVDSDT